MINIKYEPKKISEDLDKAKIVFAIKDGSLLAVSAYINGVHISFHKSDDLKFIIQSYDLRKSEIKDNRLEFLKIGDYTNNEPDWLNLVLDFDYNHHDHKKIHLNCKYTSKNNIFITLNKLLDHFELVYDKNKTEKTITLNFEKTLLSLLDHLGKKKFYSNFDSFSVMRISPTNDVIIDSVRKTLLKYLPEESCSR